MRDFDISIGKEKCPLKEVYHNAIYCNPPSNPPEISLDHPQKLGLPHVMVSKDAAVISLHCGKMPFLSNSC